MGVEEFHEYWRKNHGVLVKSIPGFRQYIRRYVQSHTIPQAYARHEAPFDGIAELWFDNLEAVDAFLTDSEYLAKVRPDELKLFAGRLDELKEVGASGVDGKFTVKVPAGLATTLIARAEGGGMDFLFIPPLYRLTHGAKSVYAMDDADRERKGKREFKQGAKGEVSRDAVTGMMAASDTRTDWSIRWTSGPRALRSTSSVKDARASSASWKTVSILLSTRATATGCSSERNRSASRR